MEKIRPLAQQLACARWLPPLSVALVLAVLGGTIAFGTFTLRQHLRRQMVNEHGQILDAVALLEQLGADSAAALTQQVEDPSGQLALALRLTKLTTGVMAVRLYDARGQFVVSLPAAVRALELSDHIQARLQQLEPISHLNPRATLADIFLPTPDPKSETDLELPLLSVLIPLHAENQTQLLAVAELIQDASGLVHEQETLDRHLIHQAGMGFLATGGLVGLTLGWAFRRLQLLNRRFQDQAVSLRRANQELALAAKTSAIGAVTAHLVHGLTSPLNGLQHFVATHARDDGEGQDALRGTQRMQALLGEVTRLLGEDTGDVRYELPLCELNQVVSDRIEPAAQAAGVKLELHCQAGGQLSNRDANLVLLILENLLDNAVQASLPGRVVRLTVLEKPGRVCCQVADNGPGLPDLVQRNLFMPVHSTKPGGNGLGLAISQRLARHLNATLNLERTGTDGTVFTLELPAKLFVNGYPAKLMTLKE